MTMLQNLRRIMTQVPVLGPLGVRLYALCRRRAFPGSAAYWQARYRAGGCSGVGSYGRLAEFKAQVLNDFVTQQQIQSVIEFGCGDGNQLALARYPRYIGLDVSSAVLARCRGRFADDSTKSFYLYDPLAFLDNQRLFRADLALSLDVIFHNVEDEPYEEYMTHLFQAATKFVVVYSSDFDQRTDSAHVRHRRFTDWVAANRPDWTVLDHVPNPYPYSPSDPETSSADFFIFRPRPA